MADKEQLNVVAAADVRGATMSDSISRELTSSTAPDPVGNSLAMIERMASNPAVDPAKLRELLAFQKDVMSTQAKIEFDEAMARLQPLLPQIKRDAKGHNAQYAKYENVDKIVRPFYTAEGFTISYDTRGQTHFGTITHRAGHSRTCQIDFSPDKSGNKNDPQAIISALSYAKRNLLQMLLNIVTTGEDDDGAGSPITDEQAKEIKDGLRESGLDVALLLKTLKVENVEAIPLSAYKRAMTAINAKKWENLSAEKKGK